MKTTHEKMTVARLSPEQHAMTCGYWYAVLSQSISHTAFVTREGLNRWLKERGLTLASELGNEPGCTRIIGSYRTESHLHDADKFRDLSGELTRTLSNGDWVKAVITIDPDGIRTVHTLNPNVRDREAYDYFESHRMMM